MAYDYDRRVIAYSYDRRAEAERTAELEELANAYKGWETRREREEAVTVNLPPDLLPLWNRVKYQFKGTPAKRLREFLEYAHNHGGEGIDALQGEADKKLQKMLRDLKKEEQRGYPSDWDTV